MNTTTVDIDTKKSVKSRIPRELKKFLIDIDVRFTDWAKYHGFNISTCVQTVQGRIQGMYGISDEIKRQLKKDFPDQFDPGKIEDDITREKRILKLQNMRKEIVYKCDI